MKKLEWLNLASNSLNVMDDNALGNLHSLLHLNMAHNRFVALPSDLFHEAKYLQVFTTYIYFYFDKLYLKYLCIYIFCSIDLGLDSLSHSDVSDEKNWRKKAEQFVIYLQSYTKIAIALDNLAKLVFWLILTFNNWRFC